MKSNKGKLIQSFNSDGYEIGMFRIASDSCPIDHLETVIQEYFDNIENEDETFGTLFQWGLERVYTDFEVSIKA